MATSNLGDKTQRITVRFTKEQFSFIAEMAEVMGVSPSDVLRMMINASMVTWRKKGAGRRENESASLDDFV